MLATFSLLKNVINMLNKVKNQYKIYPLNDILFSICNTQVFVKPKPIYNIILR